MIDDDCLMIDDDCLMIDDDCLMISLGIILAIFYWRLFHERGGSRSQGNSFLGFHPGASSTDLRPWHPTDGPFPLVQLPQDIRP